MNICLLDPGIENNSASPSSNLGDLIIQDAISREINRMFHQHNVIRFSTHIYLKKQEFKALRNCSLILVGGTNLISSNMNSYNQWKISIIDAFKIKNAILLGVGWWQYQSQPNFYTKTLLNAVLSKTAIHSVRDSYTQKQLELAGIRNVINTGCPTMWPLADIKTEEFPFSKSENVLLMLTDYNKNIELDKKLLEILFYHYNKIYFWPQGRGDKTYISELDFPVTVLDESLEALDRFINSGLSFDYIGTRLHGGIRCLCSKKRSLILEIDNRAKEIAHDTNLPTAHRADFEYINQWINGKDLTKIKLNIANIEKWKSQFFI